MTGQFVRALDDTFHLDCFRCKVRISTFFFLDQRPAIANPHQDCGQIVASKFFPADDGLGTAQYPLCETDYFRRLGLLCYHCNGALRGSYITALDRKYHVDHFTCHACPTVFGAKDSYYEHDGLVYCHYHYSTRFAQRCNGCQTAILKQFVEIYRNGQDQHWHPACYMIHKFWNVQLAASQDAKALQPPTDIDEAASRIRVREEEAEMEDKVYRIWSVLSTFEESCAACISSMLFHVSNGAYADGVVVANRFIAHVEILFRSADNLDASLARIDAKSKHSRLRHPYCTLHTNVPRIIVQPGGTAPMQEDCRLLLPPIKVAGCGRAKGRRDPRTSIRCHEPGTLPKAPHSDMPTRRTPE